MSTKIGTPLAPRTVAWVWFAVAAGFSVVSGLWAVRADTGWTLSAVSTGIALLIYLELRLRRREVETVQVDDVGILRVEGPMPAYSPWIISVSLPVGAVLYLINRRKRQLDALTAA
jgi:hypothetical protein